MLLEELRRRLTCQQCGRRPQRLLVVDTPSSRLEPPPDGYCQHTQPPIPTTVHAHLAYDDSTRRSDTETDAFSLVLAQCAGSMAPVEDQYSPPGMPRAARFNLRLAVRFRVDGDPEWRSGTTANLSRSGVLIQASEAGGRSPQSPTDPQRHIEIVIEVADGATPSQVHCRATIARVIPHDSVDDPGAIAATVGDYVLQAN